MLLLITGSADGTMDLLVDHLREPFFRWNVDDLASYEVAVELEGWKVSNPVGREITSHTATRCMWWKPPFLGASDDNYVRDEVAEMARAIYSWFEDNGSIRGNSPILELQWGKMRQARLARHFFELPRQMIFRAAGLPGAVDETTAWVVKSLSSQLVAPGRAIFTTEVDLHSLDQKYPWYVQEKVLSIADITVFVVGEKMFAWSRDRTELSSLDWRQEQLVSETKWLPYQLRQDQERNILAFCRRIPTSWGRLDFLLQNRELIFLEINTNGQWAFLDLGNERGIFNAVADYLEGGQPG